MKITKERLRQLVKKEIQNLLKESKTLEQNDQLLNFSAYSAAFKEKLDNLIGDDAPPEDLNLLKALDLDFFEKDLRANNISPPDAAGAAAAEKAALLYAPENKNKYFAKFKALYDLPLNRPAGEYSNTGDPAENMNFRREMINSLYRDL